MRPVLTSGPEPAARAQRAAARCARPLRRALPAAPASVRSRPAAAPSGTAAAPSRGCGRARRGAAASTVASAALVAAEVGHQRPRPSPAAASRARRRRSAAKCAGAAVGQVVARDAGDHDVAQAEAARRLGDARGSSSSSRRRRAHGFAAARSCQRPARAPRRRHPSPVPPEQKRQARVHASPRMRKVAVPDAKHSPLLGQRASSQTVCRSSSSSRAPVARNCRARRRLAP